MAAGPLPRGEKPVGSEDDKADPGMVALLSLNLLLLAFFILLIALSRFEQNRVERVVESITQAFGARFDSEFTQPSSPAGLGLYDAMKPVAEALRRTVAATLPVEVAIEVRRDGELRIEIPSEVLFASDAAAPLATVRPLLVELARALTGPRFEAHPWSLDASAPLSSLAGGASAAERDLAIRRAAALVRSLRGLGLPEGHLAAGLLEGDTQMVRLAVRPLYLAPGQPEGERP